MLFLLPCSSRNNYEEVDGLSPDKSKAMSYYKKSQQYQRKRNEGKYVEFVTKAAEMGLSEAQLDLGTRYLYLESSLPPENREEARKWLQMAVDQDDKIAKQYLDKLGSRLVNHFQLQQKQVIQFYLSNAL